MGYFQVRYDSRVVNYDRRGFIRLTTGQSLEARFANILCLQLDTLYQDHFSWAALGGWG